jgi:putative selenate reductase FAD-binding subunit
MVMDIVRPQTVREAVRAKEAPGAAYLGGGTWLNSGSAPETAILISLENLGLGTIEAEPDGCTIGASVTLQQLIDADPVPGAVKAAAKLTASRTLRNMQTIGGELGLCPADSALIPVLLALDAAILLAGSRGAMPIADFWLQKPDDLVLSITIPEAGRTAVVRALSRTSHSLRSLVIVACAPGENGGEACVVLSDCREECVVIREPALNRWPLPSMAKIEEMVRSAFSPAADIHASAEYKRYIAGVLAADMLHGLAAGKVSD